MAVGIALLAAVLGTVLLHRYFAGGPLGAAAAIPAWLIGIFAASWLPLSAWLLRRKAGIDQQMAAEAAARHTQAQIEMFRASRRDSLTGLQSRLAFLDALSTHFAEGGRFGLLLIDIDGFNEVNSLHGDPAGNEVLLAFADRLRTISGRREHVARLDGDEFALLLDRADDIKNMEQAAARVLRILSEPYPAAGQLVDIRLSMGIACAPTHGDTAETLMRAARVALDLAKQAGGGTWRLCGLDLSEQLLLRNRFRAELSGAIEAGQIVPYYQPIVHLPSGEVAKFEVLARWRHPKLGLLTPDQFIPLAEELGLAGHVSVSLLRQMALDCAHWPDWCRYAINVSAGQMRELISLISNQPGEWQRRMDLSQLDVEITENALLRDRDMARELIEALHEHGARAGLDNFGSGYSNLSHLADLPFDTIKISKHFIGRLLDDPRAEACVMAMLWLGHGLNITMVADGVERPEIAERLAQMGCHFAQGFLYAHPMPAEDVAVLLDLPVRPLVDA